VDAGIEGVRATFVVKGLETKFERKVRCAHYISYGPLIPVEKAKGEPSENMPFA